MSHQLINHSPDLKKLRDEGYAIEVRSGHLILRDVPYLTSNGEVKRGLLVSTLTISGDKAAAPDTHVSYFAGETPCHEDLSPIAKIINQTGRLNLGSGLEVDHTFSAKPKENGGRYLDYYEKMTTYVAILSGPAQVKDQAVTAKTFEVIPSIDDPYFEYIDTATSRASIGAVSEKLRGGKIAIIGLGGTGSYILDQVAKTPVSEIHLFDDDTFLQHNAFRSPGAPAMDELKEKVSKTDYFKRMYSRMKKGIVSHPHRIEGSSIEKLRGMSFVFICVDSGDGKRAIVEKLEEFGIDFIDVGMGVYQVDGQLGGILRVTTSTKAMRAHVKGRNRISFQASEANDYSTNIQIADLNALNAILAVIKWKKIRGFYLDFENEHFTTYTLDGNVLVNEDKQEEV